MIHSHSQQPGHHGAKAIKQEAIYQTQEVVEERGDGENQRELLILFTTVCKDQKQRTHLEHHLIIHFLESCVHSVIVTNTLLSRIYLCSFSSLLFRLILLFYQRTTDVLHEVYPTSQQ